MLAKYPDVQEVVYQELRQKYRDKNSVNLSKINECVMLRAFLYEIFRVSVAVPRFTHGTYEDVKIKLTKDNVSDEFAYAIGEEYVITKDCYVEFGWAKIFDDKKPFNIYDWLVKDEINNTYKFTTQNNPNTLPFGYGKRSCPGEQIARRTINFTLLQLILNYKFSLTVPPEQFIINTNQANISEIQPKLGIKIEKRK